MASRPVGDGHVSFGLRAPAPRTGMVPVLHIHSSSWHDLLILTSRCYGVEVYYDGARTQPITDGQRADPEVYASLFGKRWQGWLAARPYHSATVYLVAVTKVTVACVPQLDDETCDLRGWTLGLMRESGDPRGKLKGRWNGVQAPLDKLPHPPDVVDILERMWRAPLKRHSLASGVGMPGLPSQVKNVLKGVADSLTIPN